MKKSKRNKARLISLALIASSTAMVAPAVVPQSVLAAEADGANAGNGSNYASYTIKRNINFVYRNPDGSTSPAGSAYQAGIVYGPNVSYTFPEAKVSDFLSGDWSMWKADRETIPSVTATYNNPPEDVTIYLSLNTDNYTSEEKTVTRTVEYYILNNDGSKRLYSSYSDSVKFSAGRSKTEEYKFIDITVNTPAGYTADRNVITGRTVNPLSENFKEEVYFTKNASQDVTTTYTVTFTDGLGNTLKTEKVESGKAATAPAAPTRSGYTFAGWDKSFNNITGNTTVNAKWTQNAKSVTETKTVTRTIKFVKRYTDGRTENYGSKTQSATFSRMGTENANGERNMPAWPTQTWDAVTVPTVAGFAAEKKVIPAVTFTPDNAPKDETVYLNQLPTKTESKTIKRTIKFIGKKINGTEVSLGSASQSITLYRTVYTDENGKTQVISDWGKGTIREYAVPEKDGYTKTQDKVPALAVTASSKDTEVKVYYNEKSNFTGALYVSGVGIRYYKNGAFDASYTGTAKGKSGKTYYFVKGVLSKVNRCVKASDGRWIYVKAGVFDNTYTGAVYSTDKVIRYVKNGVFDSSFTGTAKGASGSTYYFVKGVHSKVDRCVKASDGRWICVKAGVFDNTYTGALYSTDKVIRYVKNGVFDPTFNGTAKGPSGKSYNFVKGIQK